MTKTLFLFIYRIRCEIIAYFDWIVAKRTPLETFQAIKRRFWIQMLIHSYQSPIATSKIESYLTTVLEKRSAINSIRQETSDFDLWSLAFSNSNWKAINSLLFFLYLNSTKTVQYVINTHYLTFYLYTILSHRNWYKSALENSENKFRNKSGINCHG